MTVGENPESQPSESTTPSSDAAPASVPPAADTSPPQPEAAQPATETSQPVAESSQPAAESASEAESSQPAAAPRSQSTPPAGPLSAAVRRSGPLAARGGGAAKPSSPSTPAARPPGAPGAKKPQGSGRPQSPRTQETSKSPATAAPSQAVSSESLPGGKQPPGKRPQGPGKRDRRSSRDDEPNPLRAPVPQSRIAIPSKRSPLSDDIQRELDAELAAADLDSLMSASAEASDRKGALTEGQRVEATVLKIHDDNVFVALGGPDEGIVPFEQFAEEPTQGQVVEVIVRGFSRDDGLYICVVPGQTVDINDLDDLEEGDIVEATITATNSGGLECTVGNAPGFIPISQITEHRIEDTSEFVGQKLVCAITECNPRRKRLVLSRRAVLEREREERRKEQMEQLEVGHTLEGLVRSVKDFGAFVDLGGCDGLIHISKLSWDRVQHPSEVLTVGQKVQVVIEQIDKETGKISLSYRDLIANPWDTVDADFPVGEIVRGSVTRIANFGAFVRLGAGIEGLIHISELAHHRVSRVNNVVNEGDEVEVKVQSIDPEAQRISLSLKAAQAAPAAAQPEAGAEEPEEPPREPAIKPQHTGPLKGGTGGDSGGERFGLRW